MDAVVVDRQRFIPFQEQKKPAQLPKSWDYEISREYFLALSKGESFRLPTATYPTEMTLNQGWHKTLDGMRQYSSEKKSERYFAIGYKDAKDALFLPIDPAHGREGAVTGHEIGLHEERMKQNGKFSGFVGDVHSHPREVVDRPIKKLEDIANSAFSIGDLYGFIMSPDRSVIGVVDGQVNIFAFKTQESKTTNAKDYQTFAEAWYRRNGWKYDSTSNLGEMASPTPDAVPLIELNRRIANEYGLALYRGEKGKPLKRIYPEAPHPSLRQRIISKVNPFVPKR